MASLVETSALVRTEEGGWLIDRSAPEEVPEVLERLVRSRVDGLLPQPREVVLAASVLGPEFGLSTMAAVTDLGGDLTAALSGLCDSGLLVEQRQLPEPAYRFRHALIQDAIYVGLLRRPAPGPALSGRLGPGKQCLGTRRRNIRPSWPPLRQGR